MKIYQFKERAPRRVPALVKHIGIEAELFEADLMWTPNYLIIERCKFCNFGYTVC